MINEQWLANAKMQAALLDGLPVRFRNWDCVLRCGHYAEGRIAIELVSTTTSEPVAIATANFPEYNETLSADEVIIKDYAENEGILAALEGAGILQATGDVVGAGHAKAKVARLLIEKGLGIRHMDSRSVLARVASGQSDKADAEQLRKWLYPDDRGQTVKSYLWLMCNSEKARGFIAADLRKDLAQLLTDDPVESAQPAAKVS